MTGQTNRIDGRLVPVRSYCHWCGRPHNPNWGCRTSGWERLTLRDLREERVGFLDGPGGRRYIKAQAQLRTAREALVLALQLLAFGEKNNDA